MSGDLDDEFDSGDDLFDGITEDYILQSVPAKRGGASRPTVEPLLSIKKPRLTLDQPQPAREVDADEEQNVQLAQKILKDKFGYNAFRHEQQAAIARVLDGKNTLVVFPTGAGKSLCYQVRHVPSSSEPLPHHQIIGHSFTNIRSRSLPSRSTRWTETAKERLAVQVSQSWYRP